MKYLIIRRDTPQDPPLFYAGDLQWIADRRNARTYDGDKASVICENFAARYGYNVTFSAAADPIAELAADIAHAEAIAPALADVPFALEAPISQRKSKQRGLL